MADDSSSKVESAMEKIKEKLRHDGDSDGSSSDSSDSDSEISSKVKSKIRRLFGRQKPVHAIFGGGKRTFLFLSFFLFYFFLTLRGFVGFLVVVIGWVFLLLMLVCGFVRSVVLCVMLELFGVVLGAVDGIG